jgi:hypothetical protein
MRRRGLPLRWWMWLRNWRVWPRRDAPRPLPALVPKPPPVAPPEPPPVQRERRRSERHPCSIETACHVITALDDDPWPARAVDISTGGAALLLARRFEPGTILTFELQSLAQEDFMLTLVARVQHAAPYPDGGWRLGCVFSSKIAEDDIQSLFTAVEAVAS